MIWVNGMQGIAVNCPMYARVFSDSDNIIHLENEPGKLFVSKEYCEDVLDDAKNIVFQQVDGLLSGIHTMPVELAADVLNTSLGKKIIEVFTKKMMQKDLTLEDKCKHIYRFLSIREVLYGLNQEIFTKNKNEKKHLKNLIKLYNHSSNISFILLTYSLNHS